jgi:hypothetical protein
MTKNRFQLGVMPTILLVIFIATAFTAINFARKPASEERRAALLEQALPHPATAAWAEQQLADQPRLSNGAAVRLQHTIKSRLQDNAVAEAVAVAVAVAQPGQRPLEVDDAPAATPARAVAAAAPRSNVTEDDRSASEPWRMAFGSLAVLAAVASMLWAALKRRA